MTETIDGSVNIVNGKDLLVANGGDVRIKEPCLELAQAKGSSRSKDSGNVSTRELRAAVKLERQG